MIWQHFTAFIWLRWRLLYNQYRRAGRLNAVLLMIALVGAVLTAIPLFMGSFLLAESLIPRADPAHLMYAWDGLLAAFLLFWCVGLMTELLRTESLALSKFLHLPVSPNGAFLINYLSSLVCLSLIFFTPIMLGFALALVRVEGLAMLLALPLVVSFLLMVTALTYQFQGWLASLMSNPRRRRTVIVTATMVFVLIFQLPQLINFLGLWGANGQLERSSKYVEELKKLNVALTAQEIDIKEHKRGMDELTADLKRANEQDNRKWEQTVQLANMVLPVGWLPFGVMSAASGAVLPSILGIAGMTLIGAASLWRAYRTTVGLYQGQSTSRRVRPAPVASRPAAERKPGDLFLERRLPRVSEPVSAIALAGLRSLLRAPEAKMMLLSPVFTAIVFGSLLWRSRHGIPEPFRPMIALGAMGFVLIGLLQLVGNQFGFDRDGFRVFVLCAARRRDILLGKNLSFAPLALGVGFVELAIVQAIIPLRIDQLLAMIPLFLSMFLLFCMLANLMSIYAPLYLAPGSLKATNVNLKAGFLQFLMFLVLFPLTQSVAFVPLGVEAWLRFLGWSPLVPLALPLALMECAAVVFVYHHALIWEGSLFQLREQQILDVVTRKAI